LVPPLAITPASAVCSMISKSPRPAIRAVSHAQDGVDHLHEKKQAIAPARASRGWSASRSPPLLMAAGAGAACARHREEWVVRRSPPSQLQFPRTISVHCGLTETMASRRAKQVRDRLLCSGARGTAVTIAAEDEIATHDAECTAR
jgi:hypothetical protein